MSETGAKLLVSALEKAGVGTIFTLSGNQIMPIFDACIDTNIQLVHVRHEAAAVYMAEAWAQLNNDIGVALIPAGPGFANGLSPLYSAMASESPVLLLSGDSPRNLDSMGAFQELDQISISRSLTKFSRRPQSVAEISTDLATAIGIARSGRPGPVHLALPFDLLNSEISIKTDAPNKLANPEVPATDIHVIEQVMNALESAKAPIILTGPTLSQSRMGESISALQENLGIPVIPMENPRGLKDPALGGLGAIIQNADVVLLLGKVVDYTINFAKPPAFNPTCRFLALDPEPLLLEQAKRALADKLVLSHQIDAIEAAKALSQHPFQSDGKHKVWFNQVIHACSTRPYPSKLKSSANGIHPGVPGQSVQRVIERSERPVIICDGGEFGQWAQATTFAAKRIINGPAGAIGGGICYAIAAKLNHPDSSVFVLMGDGTAGFHLSEFETAIRLGTPFVAVIGNDSRWNAEYQIQLRDYGQHRLSGCELGKTRYDEVVSCLGGYGEFVDKAEQLDAALARAIESQLPACINAQIEGLPAPVMPT